MAKVWRFFRDPKNLAALTALAGALAFVWTKFEARKPEAPRPQAQAAAPTTTQEARAEGAGHAVNGAGGSSISIGAAPAPPPQPPHGAATPSDAGPVNQTATAKQGHAVNAAQSATVHITEAK